MKGADLLLKAYFEIADQMGTAIPRIIFIGRDCFWKAYNSTFLEYWKDRIPEKCRDFVSFLGQVSHDQIRDYLKKATVSVFPSRWEPFGIVCLEALSMGCPVVVSKGTGLEEVLGPALSEFAVPVTEDIQPLAEKILSFFPRRGSCLCLNPDMSAGGVPGKSSVRRKKDGLIFSGMLNGKRKLEDSCPAVVLALPYTSCSLPLKIRRGEATHTSPDLFPSSGRLFGIRFAEGVLSQVALGRP